MSGAVQARLTPLIARQLGRKVHEISPETYLEDLGASSLDLVEITLDAEREFDVLLAGRPLLDAAVLILGPGVLELDGELTDAGRRLVHLRFPHMSEAEAQALVDIADVQRQISRVSVWIEVISTLVSEIPARCAEAGGQTQTAADGIPVCSGAGDGYRKPSLEEWNEVWLTTLRDRGTLGL